MIDIHCHILPNVDDGSRGLDQSLDMIRMAQDDGIEHMIVTPHVFDGVYENKKSYLQKQFSAFVEGVENAGLKVKLSLAGEVHLSDRLFELEKEGELSFLGTYQNERVMLLELPHGRVPVGAQQLVLWLRENGIRPIIAHPERNKEFMRSPLKINPFVELGCGLQVTAGSLTGSFGEQAYDLAWQILEANLCFAVASDAHNINSRPPLLSKAYWAVVNRFNEKFADDLFKVNPSQILSPLDGWPE